MKFSRVFAKVLGCKNEEEVFSYLCNTLNDSIKYWDYFVNWPKVIGNIKDLEVDLNILNYLIGKTDIEKEFGYLLSKHPQILRLIPILLACRERDFKILTDVEEGNLEYEEFSFKPPKALSSAEISKAVKFAHESGLLEIFQNKIIKNVVDYTVGVEVGLDSNGRKNRGGTAMEKIVKTFVEELCERRGFEYMAQATSDKVREKWNLKLSVDKSSRRFDFAVFNGKSLYLLEANYYGCGGSKLKSTAGEYKALFDFINRDGHKFIWITDGLGWHSTKKPLGETFNHIDYLLNLKMLSVGLLDDIIIKNL